MDNNICANLIIEDNSSKIENSLQYLYDLQKSIQTSVYGYDFDDIRSSLGDMSKFFLMNYEAIQDELREFREAMGGVDSHSSALWKPWKSLHNEANSKKFSDLSPSELLELKFEWVDLLHFMLNLAIMIDLTPDEILNMYIAKNKENINRQANGY